MKYDLLTFVLLMIIMTTTPAKQSSDPLSPVTIAQKTKSMSKYSGFLTFYWDGQSGKIWLEIDRWEQEFLYLNSLPAGVGSNDIGLDRGQLGDRRIVKFQRVGPKVMLIQPNYSFRAVSDNPRERRAVEEAFAQSVIWGFEVAAETNGAVLVDASAFFLRDAHGVIEVLKNTAQGDYTLDLSRSAVYLPRTKNFPRNTEVEAMLTFTGGSPGEYVEQVVPSPRAITVRQHHSFVQLPDDSYQPREFDPRAGFFGISYLDYAAPLGKPLKKQFIARHRLEKKIPTAVVSEAVEPIVYYLDGGVPEPIRSALLEGARWWNQAFEAAGYQDAFQVKILPQEADPMDVRYNVIQWVHRATRGWSYGDAVIDPRTGEIIKGHITLGSLRVRQDYLIAEGLLAPYESDKALSPEMQEMALARIRQLAAHEVGHTLGLAHNFAASINNRASVMDYPHPLVLLREEGTVDLSQAYATGIGEWDKVTIQYGYQDFPENIPEKEALSEILRQAFRNGLIFISDQDARSPGGAHPLAHLWDNGVNADEELQRILKVRRVALNNFSEKNIPAGASMATLEEVLAPLYFSHRYQLEAAAKLVGGLYYTYALRGDGQTVTQMVQPARQRQALTVLLKTLQPEALAFPEHVLELIPPRAFNLSRNREIFSIRTGVTFDPLAAAEAAANLTSHLILHPHRAARLIEYHARDENYPGLGEVIDRLIEATWKASPKPGYPGEIQRVVNGVVLTHLLQLAGNEASPLQARALAALKLAELRKWIEQQMKKTPGESLLAHYFYAAAQIKKFQEDAGQFQTFKPLNPPAGSPIGSGGKNQFECGFMQR